MSTTPTLDSSVIAALGSGERPQPANALSSSLTFGWRALLKIKHVPEQLFDVTMFPILFTLMFTYVFGGAIAGLIGGQHGGGLRGTAGGALGPTLTLRRLRRLFPLPPGEGGRREAPEG